MKKTVAVVGLLTLALAAPAAQADGWAMAFSFGTFCPPPPRVVCVPPPPVVVAPPVVVCRPAVVVPAPVVCPPPVIVAPPVVCRPAARCYGGVVVTFRARHCPRRPVAVYRAGYWSGHHRGAWRCRW